MRDYGKVHTSFWMSEDVRSMSCDARILALYLLTGHHTNMIGCFRLPDGYVSEDLEWEPERVSKGFAELSEKGFATRDPASKWVLINKFLKWNPIENPNQAISAMRLFSQVANTFFLKSELARVLIDEVGKFDREKLRGCERVLEPFRNPYPNQEQEQEQEQDIDHGPSAFADDHSQQAEKDSSLESGLNPGTPEQPEPGLNPGGVSDSVGGAEKPDYDRILSAYHEILPEMPMIKILTDGRKKHIRTFWKKFQFDDARWRAYLTYIATHCRWMLEDRPNGNGGFWKRKNLDYLITERCYVAVKEERANDR
ncbi:TPA: DNA-binding protein [Escherichia coli]